MCGITGIIKNIPIDLLDIKRMNDTLYHRGPDGYGYLTTPSNSNMTLLDRCTSVDCCDHHFSFGHRRLAIHDLSEVGAQPMRYLERYWVVFNGEIYNYLELKKELEKKGYEFKSKTDTEVLIAAYDHYGVDCLQKFNGDWAFVLIDAFKNKVFIARDRFGIKPLYIYFKKGLFLFASEIKALLEHPDVERKPNLKYIDQYLKHGSKEYLDETAFENIFHFNFSSYFEGNLSELLDFQKSKLKIFYEICPNLSKEKVCQKMLQDYSKQYWELLVDAVSLRMKADVKVGASLSGGLDSSSIVYLMDSIQKSEKSETCFETFSSVYHTLGTQDCDESRYINEFTNKLNLTSHQIEPSTREIPSEHRKMIYYLDTPPDSTLMSSWYTAKLLQKEKVTVTLTGEGADEQLAGYLRYITYFFSQLSFKDIFSNSVHFKKIEGSKPYLISGIILNIAGKVFGKKITQFFYSLTGRNEKLLTPLNEKLKEDILTCLVNLHHVDERVFMAFSIEQRSPFMDHRFVEWAASIPSSYKLAVGSTKYLSRFAFRDKLPESIVWSKKKLGWPTPEKFWFDGDLKLWLEKTIQSSEFLKAHCSLWVKNFKKKPLHVQMRLLNLAVWHDVFL